MRRARKLGKTRCRRCRARAVLPSTFHGSTPRWSSVELTERQVARPQEGLIVVAYKAHASLDGGDDYEAHCTSTYRRLGHEEWRVVQHQQTPPLLAPG